MAENKHIYLKNKPKANDGFKKTRNVGDNDSEIEPSKLPNPAQQNRLRRAHIIYYGDRKLRNEKRTIEVPAKIELIRIYFFKVFNDDLKKKLYKNYGLLVSSYEDFNKTVLFEIVDLDLFKIFVKHLELFYESLIEETYQGKEYNLIALIHNFRFLTTKRRIKSYSAGLSSFGLIPPQNKAASSIYDKLLIFLKEKNKGVYSTDLTPEFIEVEGLSKEEIEVILDNFDIIKTVSSTRTERRRPGQFGEVRRDYGFTINVSENISTVGVIDTGLSKIEPLLPCITDINYDLTNTGSYWDESGHGTAVASLIALGQDFFEIQNSYEAKAKIAVIKAIQQDNDNVNIVNLLDGGFKS